jgi:GTPase Era involved in 16S rRNA processing
MNLSQSRASFAVVGHPNKGKSSIVSTLAQDDSVAISQQSGTTTHSDHYKIDTGNAGFELIDTPGFQRPRKVLQWLNRNAQSADQRSEAVKKFVNDPHCKQQFPDEVQLLRPLVNGAAILYVVDGSRPYGVEYEAEMEILRWTGRPSMALINPIEDDSHVESWKNALQQFFKIVRVFNPMQADFSKQLSLLEAFSHLEPNWQMTLNQVVLDLRQHQKNRIAKSQYLLAELLIELCSFHVQQKVLTEEQAKALKPMLEKRYHDCMRDKEKQAFKQLSELFSHHQCVLESVQVELPPDLFDSEQWYVWGLNKKQLTTVSTMTGALTGAVMDAAVAGHSFMLGAIGGGIVGFTSAWLGADKLANTSIKGLPLGGYQACFGPMKNLNFPYVIIGRFLYLYEQLKVKNHADRSAIQMSEANLKNKIDNMQKSQSKELHLACKKLISQKPIDNLVEVIAGLF